MQPGGTCESGKCVKLGGIPPSVTHTGDEGREGLDIYTSALREEIEHISSVLPGMRRNKCPKTFITEAKQRLANFQEILTEIQSGKNDVAQRRDP